MRVIECTAEEAAPHLGAVFSRKANPHQLEDMATLLQGCRCFLVHDGRNIAATYALKGQGGEVWIQAAAGSARLDLCDLLDDLAQQHGAGFQSIGFRTYRRGLVKKARDRGYHVADDTDGYTMRKEL